MPIVLVCRGLPTSGSKLQGQGNGIPTSESIKVAGVGQWHAYK